MFLTVVFALLLYLATLVLVGGLAYKIFQDATTPAPLKIPTTPAPVTRAGVVVRMAKEVFLFHSLFRSNKWIWIFGWIFHMGMFLVLARHLRYFTEPVWGWVALIQPFGMYASFAMVAGLAGLWARRVLVDRVRYISAPSDHLMLGLLVAIALSGMSMTFLDHTDIVSLKAFLLGLMYFDWGNLHRLPADPLLLLHLLLVAGLMIVFPFSKLLHAPGVFFSPTRNQVDNPRERRHLATWAARLESGGRG
ncbi:MAG: respiratory nitrate reductase subunit gamma [Candidatus Nanopelagicales bacterium]|nr:respiratory nitrate reductase subunit gamma [Candidatus Nanopelagicales bacterium]